MTKEWALLAGVALLTTVIALAAVRWFSPQLLGIPIDLQSVQVGEEISPFYDSIFRREDPGSVDFLLKDPYTRVRARPFYARHFAGGPHDVLGFRNRNIPNVADVIIIGDSQTYGNNVLLEYNWPSQFEKNIKPAVVYNMATGGWGAVQYLDMFAKSLFFRPKVVVIAFYSGNDPMESYVVTYGTDRWHPLKTTRDLDEADRPRPVKFPPPEDELWPVSFDDGVSTVFSPSLRLKSNNSNFAVVREGWAIIATVAEKVNEMAKKYDVALVYTIIPTKELVYKKKIEAAALAKRNETYRRLVSLEQENIENLIKKFRHLSNVTYVDVVTPLQQAATRPIQLYPRGMNGHPLLPGYEVIAQSMAPVVSELLPRRTRSLAEFRADNGDIHYFVVTDNGVIGLTRPDVAKRNGWRLTDARPLVLRDFTRLPFLGYTGNADPERLGPSLIQD